MSRLTNCCAAFALALAACPASASEVGFSSSLTGGLVERLSEKFGAGARMRLESWQEFIARLRLSAEKRRHLSPREERQILDSVNSFFNRIPFVEDARHWGVVDYWASPAEMLASNGGDCEDFSIAKYFALKEIGVPTARLRITHVEATSGSQAHMVLAYYPPSGGEPLVLDNLSAEVRPAGQRPDLTPVYQFNDEEVRVPGIGSVGGAATRMRPWRGLLARLERERRG